jgi:hypothetical protein
LLLVVEREGMPARHCHSRRILSKPNAPHEPNIAAARRLAAAYGPFARRRQELFWPGAF